MCAVFLGPGDGERLDGGATQIVIKATGDDTGGSLDRKSTRLNSSH